MGLRLRAASGLHPASLHEHAAGAQGDTLTLSAPPPSAVRTAASLACRPRPRLAAADAPVAGDSYRNPADIGRYRATPPAAA